jgi:hypothetical protein
LIAVVDMEGDMNLAPLDASELKAHFGESKSEVDDSDRSVASVEVDVMGLSPALRVSNE